MQNLDSNSPIQLIEAVFEIFEKYPKESVETWLTNFYSIKPFSKEERRQTPENVIDYLLTNVRLTKKFEHLPNIIKLLQHTYQNFENTRNIIVIISNLAKILINSKKNIQQINEINPINLFKIQKQDLIKIIKSLVDKTYNDFNLTEAVSQNLANFTLALGYFVKWNIDINRAFLIKKFIASLKNIATTKDLKFASAIADFILGLGQISKKTFFLISEKDLNQMLEIFIKELNIHNSETEKNKKAHQNSSNKHPALLVTKLISGLQLIAQQKQPIRKGVIIKINPYLNDLLKNFLLNLEFSLDPNHLIARVILRLGLLAQHYNDNVQLQQFFKIISVYLPQLLKQFIKNVEKSQNPMKKISMVILGIGYLAKQNFPIENISSNLDYLLLLFSIKINTISEIKDPITDYINNVLKGMDYAVTENKRNFYSMKEILAELRSKIENIPSLSSQPEKKNSNRLDNDEEFELAEEDNTQEEEIKEERKIQSLKLKEEDTLTIVAVENSWMTDYAKKLSVMAIGQITDNKQYSNKDAFLQDTIKKVIEIFNKEHIHTSLSKEVEKKFIGRLHVHILGKKDGNYSFFNPHDIRSLTLALWEVIRTDKDFYSKLLLNNALSKKFEKENLKNVGENARSNFIDSKYKFILEILKTRDVEEFYEEDEKSLIDIVSSSIIISASNSNTEDKNIVYSFNTDIENKLRPFFGEKTEDVFNKNETVQQEKNINSNPSNPIQWGPGNKNSTLDKPKPTATPKFTMLGNNPSYLKQKSATAEDSKKDEEKPYPKKTCG